MLICKDKLQRNKMNRAVFYALKLSLSKISAKKKEGNMCMTSEPTHCDSLYIILNTVLVYHQQVINGLSSGD